MLPPLIKYPRLFAWWRIALIACCASAFTVRADTFHVSLKGTDESSRDGLSESTAWRSLAYACERVPEGRHTIRIGSGTFIAARTAWLKSGFTVVGNGREGDAATRLIAAPDWKLTPDLKKANPPEEYLIAVRRAESIAIRDLILASNPAHRITGGLFVTGAKELEIANLHVHDFRWAGLHVEQSSGLNLHHCQVVDACTEKHGHENGLIRSRWLKHSEIHHNRIISTVPAGYGYKAGGHERVRIHHNFISTHYFAIESAHENEFGVEIDHNHLTRCISIPKGGQAADPKTRGCDYSFWIHDNLLTDSYTVEGPRNHLRLERNYIRCEKPNGRIYTHHGGLNHGPVWIHHNLVENADRAFIWMNNGLAENVHVFNNTVVFADAGDRAGSILGAGQGDRLNGWVVKNNLFIAPASQPRQLMPGERGVPEKITATGNLCVNVTGAPAGNYSATETGLKLSGDKPLPFYAPAGPRNFVVDRGTDVGLPFTGKAPDLGAIELGDTNFVMPGVTP